MRQQSLPQELRPPPRGSPAACDEVLVSSPPGALAALVRKLRLRLPVHPLQLEKTLPYGDVQLLVARDHEQRCFLGLALSRGTRGNVVLVQVERDKLDALEGGQLSLHTLIREHGVGLVIELPRAFIGPQVTPA